MSELIQWPRAKYWTAQWNPVIGCKPCSPACENCYAAAWAKRFGQSFEPHKSAQKYPPKKGVVFCGNLTDCFGNWREPITTGNDIIHTAIRGSFANDADATYLWLTKRVDNMCAAIDWAVQTVVPERTLKRHYFGITAENQQWFDERSPRIFVRFPRSIKLWLSLEPLLGPIDFRIAADSYSWVVVGCESGPNRRPCKIEWVESIVDQCRKAGVPVFVKQLDIGGKCVTDIDKFPEHLRIRQVPWSKEGGAK